MSRGSITARGCVFFYSHSVGEHACLSNFYPASFVDDVDGCEYNCSEQWMMAGKARVFRDAEALDKILACGYDPRRIKALGRSVRNFVPATWEAAREAIVTRGVFLKFSQNHRLHKVLLGTGELTLVEAARNDKIWGIGVGLEDAAAGRPWRGLNLLGKCLMTARAALAAGSTIATVPVQEVPAASAPAPDSSQSQPLRPSRRPLPAASAPALAPAPAPAPAPASPDGAEQGDLFAQRSSRRVRIEAVEKEREEERRRQRRSEAKQANGRRRAEKRRAKEARAFGAEQQRQLLVDQAVVSCNPDLCRSLRGSDLSQCLWPGRALGAAFGGGDPQGGGGGGHRGAIGRRR